MSKKHYADRNLKFETLQLHVGQEQADPVTDARSIVLYIRFSGNQKQSVPIFTLWKFNNMALTLRSQLL